MARSLPCSFAEGAGADGPSEGESQLGELGGGVGLERLVADRLVGPVVGSQQADKGTPTPVPTHPEPHGGSQPARRSPHPRGCPRAAPSGYDAAAEAKDVTGAKLLVLRPTCQRVAPNRCRELQDAASASALRRHLEACVAGRRRTWWGLVTLSGKSLVSRWFYRSGWPGML